MNKNTQNKLTEVLSSDLPFYLTSQIVCLVSDAHALKFLLNLADEKNESTSERTFLRNKQNEIDEKAAILDAKISKIPGYSGFGFNPTTMTPILFR